jgi:hypothetical protein
LIRSRSLFGVRGLAIKPGDAADIARPPQPSADDTFGRRRRPGLPSRLEAAAPRSFWPASRRSRAAAWKKIH